MRFFDTLQLDGEARINARGQVVADARVARTGMQLYSGAEVGKPELAVVRVFRPEDEVFHRDAMASFAHKPVTDDHPAESVQASNWAKLTKGFTSNDVARDGQTLRVPLMIADAALVQKWKDGKRELSCGYDCDLDWTPGVTAD